jgi:hypothetical protein
MGETAAHPSGKARGGDKRRQRLGAELRQNLARRKDRQKQQKAPHSSDDVVPDQTDVVVNSDR